MALCILCGTIMHERDIAAHVHDNPPQPGNETHFIKREFGNVIFSNSKTAAVLFVVPFPTVPAISLTLDTAGQQAPPYKQSVTVSGFTVKFAVNYTGIVTWIALK